MLAAPGTPFDADDYAFELKWDGIRCLAFLDGGTRLQSRNLKTMDEFYPELSDLHRRLRGGSPCVVDGEIIALEGGKPSFQALQKRHNARRPDSIRRAASAIPVVYMIFDLLYFRGESITRLPWRRRRELLGGALREADQYILSETFPARGKDCFAAAGALGLEGVVGKQVESPYLPGKRSHYWVKCKHTHTASFVICGYTENPTGRGRLSSLVLGAYHAGELKHYGLVGTGFSQAGLRVLEAALRERETETCPFTGGPVRLKGFHWAVPELVCEVQYLEVTGEGVLRHPLFLGMREDLMPADCVFPPGEGLH